MSWEDIMRRVLPPTKGVPPHVTSPYGESEGRPPGSSKPHPAVDFNYLGGRYAQLNLSHPALRSPVAGIVTKAGQDKWGTIAVRDANGFSHEILHTQSQHVTVGDPVVAGQLIGTMGNTGTKDQHVHYQLRDPAGKNINPTEFWDRQGLANPNPDPPAYLGEYQSFGDRFGDWTSSPAGDAPLNSPQPASQSVLPDQLNSPGDLAGWIAALAGIDPQNPNRFAPTPQNDQLRGFNRNDPLQPWFARPPIR